MSTTTTSAAKSARRQGPGPAPARANRRAFERFWRADSARTGPGSGLGLSIVSAIAEEHGGTVAAANAETGGARFTLHVPING